MIIRSCLTSIFLCGICIINAQETGYLQEGDRLFNEHHYFEASIAYERVLFTVHDQFARYAAIEGKTNSLKQQRLYLQAVNFIKANLADNYPDSLRFHLVYQQMLCAYLGGSFENALSLAEQLKFSSPTRANDPWIKVIQLFSLNELRRWKEAAELYDALLKDLPAKSNPDLFLHLPRLKNVDKARWLSTFIPGGGQFYAGKPLEALVSIIIQGAGIYYGITGFQQQYYLSAWFVGAGLFGSFHLGGVRRSEILVNQYNDKKASRFNQKVKDGVLKAMVK